MIFFVLKFFFLSITPSPTIACGCCLHGHLTGYMPKTGLVVRKATRLSSVGFSLPWRNLPMYKQLLQDLAQRLGLMRGRGSYAS